MSAVNKLNSAEAARGRFITLEGGEGCGKSTQAARLRDALAQRGLGVVLARDPGSTALAESLRGLIKDQREDAPCGSCELMLFLAARAQLVERVVRPALAAGKWVVCDRFSDSTVAYQGYGRGLPVDDIRRMNDFVCGGVAPDLTLYLSLSPEAAQARRRSREVSTRTEADRIEREGARFHARLHEGFEALAKAHPERIKTIDASGDEEAVWNQIWKSVLPLI